MKEPKMCCNCLHCARWKKKAGIECHCDLTDKYLGYLDVMDEDNNCKHWEKDTKWDLQKKHDSDLLDKVAEKLKETFNNECPINYTSTQPFFTLENARTLVDMVIKEMKAEVSE